MNQQNPETPTPGSTPGQTPGAKAEQRQIEVPEPKLKRLKDGPTVEAHAVPAPDGKGGVTWLPRVVVTYNDFSDERMRVNLKQFGSANEEDLKELAKMINYAIREARKRRGEKVGAEEADAA